MTTDPLDALLEGMARLLDEQAEAPARPSGEGNFRCQRCEGCEACRFCTDCVDCVECTYCDGCVACSGCTQSRHCRDCQRVSHSQLSRACDDSSYLTLCIGCEQCVHCFACVALQGGEFCILNEKLSRKDYNAKIAELRIALERRLARGWRPSWLGEGDEEAAADGGVAEADDIRADAGLVERVAVEPHRVAEVGSSAAAGPSVMRARPPRPEAAQGGAPDASRASAQSGGEASRASVTSARRPVRRG